MTTVGIIGAGKLGITLARLSTDAGHRTLVAGSGELGTLPLILSVMAPAATAMRAIDVAREADIVILALPLGRIGELPAAQMSGKTVVDALNYWPQTDGVIPEFEDGAASSPAVARTLPESRVVKALSHLGYHELQDDARPAGAADRRAIAIAGDDLDSVAEVAALVDSLGFDPVVVGRLDEGSLFGPGTDAFGVSLTAEELSRRVDARRASLAGDGRRG